MESVSKRLVLQGKIAPVAKTKSEFYRVLTFEGKYYLPPIKRTDIFFIKEIVSGQKLVIIIFFISNRHSRETKLN